MEIYDDPNRVYPVRPVPEPYNRHYRKNAAGKELLLVGGALFLVIGAVNLVSGIAECVSTHSLKPLLLAGCLPQFLAGWLGIKLRHYPHMMGWCTAAGVSALALSMYLLFANGQFWQCVCSVIAALLYAAAWLVNQR